MKCSWTEDITRILWRQATRNKEYGLTEASTGISVESTPSSIFIDPGSSNYGGGSSTAFTRARHFPDVSSPRAHHPTYKRHSWLSTEESSGSSGVCDLESLPEEGHMIFSPRPETEYNKSEYKFSTLPRKKHITRSSSANIPTIESYDSNSIVTLRRDLPGGFNSNFVRKNVYRNTMHCDNPGRKTSEEKLSLKCGRFATQPIVLPSKTLITKIQGSNTLPRSRSDSQPAVTGISNIAFADDKGGKGDENITEEVNNFPKSITDSQVYNGRDLTSNRLTTSVTDNNISNTTEQQKNKRNTELFSGGRLWDSLGRRLSLNRQRNDGSAVEGCKSPQANKHCRRRSDVPTSLVEDANFKISKLKLRKNTSDSNIPSSVVEQLVN